MIKKQYSKTKPVCKVTFSLTPEQVGEGSDVRVVGTFNNWSWEEGLPMPIKKGLYQAALELPAGQSYEFRYVMSNGHWLNDEAADGYVPTPFYSENGVIVLDEVVIAPKAAAESAAPKAKKTSKAQKATTADDLRKIEGIGPKIADLLALDGIKTFDDLAKAKPADIKKTLEAAGSRYKMHDPSTWPQQAELAAAGEWERLATLQEELKGGKKK